MFDTFLARRMQIERAYRYQPLLAGHGDDGVVAVGPPRGWVNEDVDVLVDDCGRRGLVKHDLDVLGLEDLLKRVERKPGKLRLNEVRPVLHDGLELDVAVRALPPAPKRVVNMIDPMRTVNMIDPRTVNTMDPPSRYQRKKQKKTKDSPGDQVKHVDALGGLALGLAGCAGQLHAQEGEDGLAREPVPHLHEPRVEVDLARERADGQEGRVSHDEQRGHRLLRRENTESGSSDDDFCLPDWASAHVKESWVDIGGLLEDNDVSPGALGGRDLRAGGAGAVSKEDEEWNARFWRAVNIL